MHMPACVAYVNTDRMPIQVSDSSVQDGQVRLWHPAHHGAYVSTVMWGVEEWLLSCPALWKLIISLCRSSPQTAGIPPPKASTPGASNATPGPTARSSRVQPQAGWSRNAHLDWGMPSLGPLAPPTASPGPEQPGWTSSSTPAIPDLAQHASPGSQPPGAISLEAMNSSAWSPEQPEWKAARAEAERVRSGSSESRPPPRPASLGNGQSHHQQSVTHRVAHANGSQPGGSKPAETPSSPSSARSVTVHARSASEQIGACSAGSKQSSPGQSAEEDAGLAESLRSAAAEPKQSVKLSEAEQAQSRPGSSMSDVDHPAGRASTAAMRQAPEAAGHAPAAEILRPSGLSEPEQAESSPGGGASDADHPAGLASQAAMRQAPGVAGDGARPSLGLTAEAEDKFLRALPARKLSANPPIIYFDLETTSAPFCTTAALHAGPR